ncbi:MAG: Eco57I restriction-modification methylase domain-containing protein, partial [Candidatus Thorarchaeota archaeon]
MAQEKALGQYFTPPHIVQLMIDLIGKGSKDRRILEPSAGKGVFINLLKKRGFSNLLGIEVDPVIANHSPFPLIIGNFFDCPISEKFDIVIGNPPYVRWKNLTKEQRNFLSSSSFWHKRMNGLTDILQPFIFKSVDHLNSGGELIFITPSFWMQTLHSYPLRRFLNENGSIEFVINFGEIRIFSNVNLNLVIFKYKKEKKNIPIKIIKIKKKAILTSKLTKF